MSWNVTGITTGIPYLLKELHTKNITVCGLSEHMLLKQNDYILKSFHKNYHAHVITCDTPRTFNGRTYGRGGVAILWHSSINEYVQTVESNSDRIAVIRIKLESYNMYIIQVYLPCSNEPLESFKNEVDTLNDILSAIEESSRVVILGDFNTDLTNFRSANSKGHYVNIVLDNHYLKTITGSDICKGSNYSFVPGLNYSPTLIDHIVIDEYSTRDIASSFIANDAPLNVSRHLPLFVYLNIGAVYKPEWNSPACARHRYKWSVTGQVDHYQDALTSLLQSQSFDFEDVNATYSTIVECLNTAADNNIAKRQFKPYLKPYWSPIIKRLHKIQETKRIEWLRYGRPRSGPIFENYKTEKRKFRCELRKAAREFERNEYERIDSLAELDQKGFWKTINSRRNMHKESRLGEMSFDGRIVSDPVNILDGWQKYFSQLYKFSENPNFDPNHRIRVQNDLDTFLASDDNECSVSLSSPITADELYRIAKTLPNEKSPSLDNISYEHIKYGGHKLMECVAKLFNTILQTETFPDKFKESITVTLHKGNGKPKSDPNNYRAISLLPTMFKLFEKVLMTRIEQTDIPAKLHPLQHGFQKGKSCKLVSFIYQEAANYCQERHGTTYSCFLDAMKAFDMTWINGILHKLYYLGVHGKSLRVFNQMLHGASSRVFAFGHVSAPYSIEQGCRQGSICSPFLYTVFINELLHELSQSRYGLTINNVNVAAPTQADDVVLLSISKDGLSKLLDMCKAYSEKWRYIYNASKCALLVINKSGNTREITRLSYSDTYIEEVHEYKHLGTVQHVSRKFPASCDVIRQSARTTLFGFINSGLHANGLNPITGAKLYTSTVLPRAFFGCELWYNIKQSDLRHLETTHHFCLKRIQNLPKLTRSDMVKGMLGFTSIEAYIDMQKLSFLGYLCRLQSSDLAYKVFIQRLFQYKYLSNTKAIGFIKDIKRVLTKYNLECHLDTFEKHSVFPEKTRWKKCCKNAIFHYETNAWLQRINICEDFQRFRNVHPVLAPSAMWVSALNGSGNLCQFNFMVKLLCQKVGVEKPCPRCNIMIRDEVLHVVYDCNPRRSATAMQQFLQTVGNSISMSLANMLFQMDKCTKLEYIFGRLDDRVTAIVSPDMYTRFIVLSAKFLHLSYTL